MTPSGRSGSPRRLWPWIVALVVLLLDQLTKAWALQHLPFGRVAPFVPGLLQLRHVTNSGAAFSLMTGNSLALGVVSAVVSLAVAGWMLWRPPRGFWLTLAASLVLAGALGNGIDRWRLGAVVDFLELVPIHFPIFNLADVAINVAVACFLLDAWQQRPRRRG
ncbi:signal peptidase II [Synechococcus sp. CBW1004]|nr:signal peptidase II [Synechococcus sp. CBW1004]